MSVPRLKLLFLALICCFTPLAAVGQEKGAAARLLTLRKSPPVYVRNEGYKSTWRGLVGVGWVGDLEVMRSGDPGEPW